MKQLVITILVITLSCLALADRQLSKTMPAVNHKILRGDEAAPDVPVVSSNEGLTTEITGYSYQDYQTIGSTGSRMAFGSDGSIYFCWTNLLSWPYPPGARHIYYNMLDHDGNWWEPRQGQQVSLNLGSGHANLDMIFGNRAAIAYHVPPSSTIEMSIEDEPAGFGIFSHYVVPNDIYPQNPPDSPGKLMWPYICVDRGNRIHLAATEGVDSSRPMRLGYTRSDDGGPTWTAMQLVDTVMVVSSVLDASPVSDRVVLAYCKASDTTSQWFNDIAYCVSEDGVTWDWQNGRHNVTDYGSDADSLWAYTDLDVIFDYNDYIHIIWNAQWAVDERVYYRTYLFHYSEETGEINTITAKPDSLWWDIEGTWNKTICKMSLGVREEDNLLAAIWTQFDTSDVSAGGYGNGDIYMSYTEDGSQWSQPANITRTYTPGCYPGECNSENWATLADVIDYQLHLFYPEDKDAGCVYYLEGAATENPMIDTVYSISEEPDIGFIWGRVTELDSLTPIENAFVLLDDSTNTCFTDDDGWYNFTLRAGHYSLMAIKEGYEPVTFNVPVPEYGNHFDFSMDRILDIDDNHPLPYTFSLSQNYPNPFNQSTSISFSIADPGPVKLEIFDITGALVKTLVDGIMTAGKYQVTWDAGELASGTYLCKLSSDSSARLIKALLVK